MKRVGLSVVILGLIIVLVGCGNSLSKMDDGTKNKKGGQPPLNHLQKQLLSL